MRYLLLCAIAFMTVGCSGQQSRKVLPPIDTTKLFDPFPESFSLQDTLMFKNNVALFQPDYVITFNSQKRTFKNLEDLSSYFSKEAIQVRSNKFFVLVDSNTKYHKIISVIDVLKENRIDNYRVINVQAYFKPPEPSSIQGPTVVTKRVTTNDSTYLTVELLENSFQLNLINKNVIAKNGAEIEKFISENESIINPDKIKVVSRLQMTSGKIQPLLDVFKKHNYMQFDILTLPSK